MTEKTKQEWDTYKTAKKAGWTPIEDGLPNKSFVDCFVLVPEQGGKYVVVEADFYNGEFWRDMIINHNKGRLASVALKVDYWMEREQVPEYE